MARSSSRHYCTVCRSWYRSWPLHASSKKHMGRLRAMANPSGSKKGARRLGKPVKARGRQQGDDMVKVTDYYRNPPTPPWPASMLYRGLYVVDHWRREPYVASRLITRPLLKRRRRRRSKR